MKIVRLPMRKYGWHYEEHMMGFGVLLGWYAITIRTRWLSDIRWAIKRRIRGFKA